MSEEQELTEQQTKLKEYIDSIQEIFISDEKIHDNRRITVLTQIQTLQSLIEAGLQKMSEYETTDCAEMMVIMQFSSILKMFNELYKRVLDLDNGRISNISRLCRILKESNLNEMLNEEIKKYDY